MSMYFVCNFIYWRFGRMVCCGNESLSDCQFQEVELLIQFNAARTISIILQVKMESNLFGTLKKLQQGKYIPTIQPIRVNSDDLYMEDPSPSKKYLLITNNYLIAYTELATNGKPDDTQAIIIFSNGAYYMGGVVKGKMSGYGKLTNQAEMYTYEGEWLNSQPNGKGQENISGNVYKGTFKDGKKDGNGQLIYTDGSIFTGTFKSNEISGFGKHETSQSEWKGFWRSGYLEGEGTQKIHSKNGNKLSSYLGMFARGERQGYGKFIWDRNREYEGNFKRGQLHGQGVLRIAGHTYRGIWEQGTDLQIKEVHVNPSIIQFKRMEKNLKNNNDCVIYVSSNDLIFFIFIR